jgi:hypothetical protein
MSLGCGSDLSEEVVGWERRTCGESNLASYSVAAQNAEDMDLSVGATECSSVRAESYFGPLHLSANRERILALR